MAAYNRRITNVIKVRIRTLAGKGYKAPTIAERLGIPAYVVYQFIRRERKQQEKGGEQ